MNDRERNRREFPTAAAVIDRYREVFGAGVRLLWWIENGKAIGSVPTDEIGGNGVSNQINQAGIPSIREHGPSEPRSAPLLPAVVDAG